MTEPAKPLESRSGSGGRPVSIVIALFLSVVLILLFDFVSHAHW